MISHKLPQDYSVVLPFGRLTVQTIGRICKGKGFLEGGTHSMLFPDGRISVKKGFQWNMPEFFLIPDRKIYIPSMVYAALDEFSATIPARDFVWSYIRKRMFIKLMRLRKVNFLTLWYVEWKL